VKKSEEEGLACGLKLVACSFLQRPLLLLLKALSVLAGGVIGVSRRFLTHRNWNYLGLTDVGF